MASEMGSLLHQAKSNKTQYRHLDIPHRNTQKIRSHHNETKNWTLANLTQFLNGQGRTSNMRNMWCPTTIQFITAANLQSKI